MMKTIPQRGGYGQKKITQFQVGDDVVVHFQQQAQAVAFTRQELLIGTRLLEIQGVFHGHRHVGRDR